MTYMGWKHLFLNESYDTIKMKINQICTVGRRDELRTHILNLLTGKPFGPLRNIFGPKSFSQDSLEFARESLLSSLDVLKTEIRSLRKKVLHQGDASDETADKIVLLKAIIEFWEIAVRQGYL